jgi:hypothetical protein
MRSLLLGDWCISKVWLQQLQLYIFTFFIDGAAPLDSFKSLLPFSTMVFVDSVNIGFLHPFGQFTLFISSGIFLFINSL